jgi:hypothetical protein
MNNDYNNLNEENAKEIELPKLKITDLCFDSLPEINEKIMEVDYLERSSSGGFLKTIFQHLKNFNPKEWIFLLFFCMIVTCKIFLSSDTLLHRSRNYLWNRF